ncbi:hypothetical protein [Enterococcus asini]|uniref:hypothetical protein n=1 Tax=Enterococcus asini TaxID=57732 RepID=UPI00241CBABF|nr:hypothetical protein [Enterococcus asini]
MSEMKVSEAIDRLKVGDTVWIKGKVLEKDTTEQPLYVDFGRVGSLWLYEEHEFSLTEPKNEKVEAHLAEHWDEDMGDVLWWNFPVEEPPYCGTPLDEHFPKYKTHFSMIDMPNEIEKPKRWVVRQGGSEVWYLQGFRNSLDGDIVKQWCSHEGCIKFTDKSKAEAVATLVEGSVEEV